MNPHDLESRLESRLESLGRCLPEAGEFVRQVMSRIAVETVQPVRPIFYRSWFMKSTIGMAASLLIAFLAFSLLFTTPRPAYALADMAARIQSLRSLHIKGIIYPQNGGDGNAIELFLEQPDRIRVNGKLDDSIPGNNRVTDIIVNSDRSAVFDRDAKTVTIAPTNTEDARLQVAQLLQNVIQTAFGAPANLKKLRSDRVNGTPVEVYEDASRSPMRLEVWFNPATGLPLRTFLYESANNAPPRLAMEWTTIEPDPVIPPGTFDIAVPAGWTTLKPPIMTDSASFGSQAGDIRFDIRYLINLGDGDMLLCWCAFDVRDPAHDLSLFGSNATLTITSASGAKYGELLLHADPRATSGCHWRWSLLRPATSERASQPLITIAVKDAPADRPGNTCSDTQIGVAYPSAELDDRIQALQKQTLPAGQRPMSLVEILAQSAKRDK